ncbi:MAG TPA: class III extradiol ring-cleavage dioxygenase [Stellaceae bacterium]|nr:class III extradiol ring-cleavage dioxygenase [Stellaceae bacterium]
MTTFDSLFVSHGSPMLALDPGPVGAFWAGLGRALPRPGAVLCVSAHWGTASPCVGGAAHPATIHDFYGFPAPLYRLAYPTAGAPALARRVTALLDAAGIAAAVDPDYGLDHGAWVPLRSFYPEGIAVTQLSVQPGRDARWHVALGRALAPLRAEDVLILASGGATHNLRAVARDGGAAPAWAQGFDGWLATALADGREADLVDWQRTAPQPRMAHPSPEHFLPLFVAYGAAGPGARGERIYDGFTLASLSMAAFRFVAA